MSGERWEPGTGMTCQDWLALRTWTEECERGLVHTAYWDAKMAGLARLAESRRKRTKGDDHDPPTEP